MLWVLVAGRLFYKYLRCAICVNKMGKPVKGDRKVTVAYIAEC